MNKKIGIFLLCLTLPACMAQPEQTTQSVEYICAASTATLRTLTIINESLSAETRANVTKAVAIINPVCSQPTVPTLNTTSHAALAGALTTLTNAAQ